MPLLARFAARLCFGPTYSDRNVGLYWHTVLGSSQPKIPEIV